MFLSGLVILFLSRFLDEASAFCFFSQVGPEGTRYLNEVQKVVIPHILESVARGAVVFDDMSDCTRHLHHRIGDHASAASCLARLRTSAVT